jgi:hypothetical protein
MIHLLADTWRPFLDPLPVDASWLLLMLPLVLGIAVVYKTIKIDDLELLPKQAFWLASQIVFYMVIAAAALWIITQLA